MDHKEQFINFLAASFQKFDYYKFKVYYAINKCVIVYDILLLALLTNFKGSRYMSNVVFFSFKEEDRGVVLTIKGRAINPLYKALNFRVRDLLKRWKTENEAVIKQAYNTQVVCMQV